MYFCPECKENVAFANHMPGCPLIPEKAAGGEKLSNPKDIIGSDKVPLSIVPGTTKAYLAIGHMEGMLKYGYVNWREAGVRVSIYLDALERHVEKYKNGEWCDEETKVPHLANAIACLSIIIDAHECGKLTDDRPKQAPVADVLTKLSENVKHLKKIYGHCNPKHYTYEEGPQPPDADLYDGTSEKREDYNREGTVTVSPSTYREEGRYSTSSARPAVSELSGTVRKGYLGHNDTKSVSIRTPDSHLRRDELQQISKGLSPIVTMEDRVLRSYDTSGSLPTTSNSNRSAGLGSGNPSDVGSKGATRRG